MSPGDQEIVTGNNFGHPDKHRQHYLMIEVPDRYFPDRGIHCQTGKSIDEFLARSTAPAFSKAFAIESPEM